MLTKIKRLIDIVPIPISGVMLSLAAMGNLLKPVGEEVRLSLGFISLIIFIFLTLKILINFKQIKIGFDNPIIAGVMSTFPMTMMIFSTYFVGYSRFIAQIFFAGGITIHLIIIILFTKKYLFNFDLQDVFPTNFIVYTGIVCASVASPALGLNQIGQVMFWIGLLGLAIMLPLVTKRIILSPLPKKVSPTIAIYTAPASLCLAGYISSYGIKHSSFTYFLFGLATINLLFVLIKLSKLLKVGFNPTYAAFTFPFVITAIAVTMSGVSTLYASFTKVIAILLVGYVFTSFIKFTTNKFLEKDPATINDLDRVLTD